MPWSRLCGTGSTETAPLGRISEVPNFLFPSGTFSPQICLFSRMGKHALKIGLFFLGLFFFTTGPVPAEMCHTEASCCVEEKAAEFNFACFVNCQNPPGVEKQAPVPNGEPDLTTPLVGILIPLPRPERVQHSFHPTPEPTHSQVCLHLARARPNPPPFHRPLT